MLGIIKGDIRYEVLAQLMSAKLSSELYDFLDIDVLLLPFGGIDEDYNIKQSKLNLLDILKENAIKTILVGNANSKLKELCEQKNIKLIELLKDYRFVIPNAKLTSMGIIDYLSRKNLAVSDQKVLIVGFGNIGFTLAELLKANDCSFSIYPTNEAEEKYAHLLGYSITDFKDYDVLINTVPYNLDWDYASLRGKRIIDVASAPYGFDINKIYEYGICYEIVSAIPSKFAYASAANIIKKYIEKYV
ncbi:MAG: hypothetical protein K2K48_01575 [Anaeroplasmataceae bacterium]|nr:hypothetical protein [Anaeroplasmataceae bacterium]MDE6414081.1 hypothetical protein [Anaeroplasmataceae bacterium]